ncbi:MAG TPA: hypothetical protein VFU65_21435 [Actinocrinis sp.]|nr:hypothetical protein [Actinocrinis sp.]
MKPVLAHDPYFQLVTAPKFSRGLLGDLAAGRIAAIRVPDFAPSWFCQQTLAALESIKFDFYDTNRVYPQVMRFGTGVSDHNVDGRIADTYWPALDASLRALTELRLPFDPFSVCREALAEQWPGGVAVGTHDGRAVGPGVIREPNGGFQVHFDDALREFGGNLLDANLVAQFAFNCYLSVPEEGGETIVWRHRWEPADEAHRLPHSYGYSETVIGNVESFVLSPQVGMAMLFNPRHFHAVRPSRGARRIALGFAMGLADSGELLVWG